MNLYRLTTPAHTISQLPQTCLFFSWQQSMRKSYEEIMQRSLLTHVSPDIFITVKAIYNLLSTWLWNVGGNRITTMNLHKHRENMQTCRNRTVIICSFFLCGEHVTYSSPTVCSELKVLLLLLLDASTCSYGPQLYCSWDKSPIRFLIFVNILLRRYVQSQFQYLNSQQDQLL